MMYNTKINEFELDEIELLLSAVNEKIDLLNGSIQRIQSWEESEIRNDLEEGFNKDLGVFILWKVQLENAKIDINEMNKVNAG